MAADSKEVVYLSRMPDEILTNICTFASTSDIFHAGLSCKRIHHNANRVLYLRDAAEENSLAIKHAVLLECVKGDRVTCRSVLDLALHYGANVNAKHPHKNGYATALAIATGFGQENLVRKLLQAGASPNVASKRFDHLPELRDRLRTLFCEVRVCLRHKSLKCLRGMRRWLPLALAMLLGEKPICRLLLNAGASVRLNHPEDRQHQPITDEAQLNQKALNAIHVCAENDDMGFGEKLIKRFPRSIDAVLEGDLGTPLHLAITNRNDDMFNKLISAGADVNKATEILEYSPLHTAIYRCHTSRDSQERKKRREYIEALVRAGADLNQSTHFTDGKTPLMILLDAAEWDWKRCYSDISDLLWMFIENGARVNHMVANGNTLVRHLIARMVDRNKSPRDALEVMLETLVTEHGANMNPPPIHNYSILGHLILRDFKTVSWRLLRLVIKLGARIADNEVDRVFRVWVGSRQLRGMYDIRLHRRQLSQAAIDEEYIRAIEEKDHLQFDVLEESFPPPSRPQELVYKVFDPGYYTRQMAERFLELDFRFQSHSYCIHAIVELLLMHDKYRESQAIEDAKRLIEHGATVLKEDGMGKTALQRLRRLGQPVYKELRYFLMEQADKERDKYD